MRNNKSAKLFKLATAFTVAASPIIATIPVQANTTAFTDVPKTSEFYDAIIDLYTRGIINGYPDGTYRPNEFVTRGQAAKILANILDLETSHVTLPYKDVPASYEHYRDIAALHERGIISGFPDGSFQPGQPITRNQMAKIIANAFELPTSTTTTSPFTDLAESYRPFIQTLYTNGITTGRTPTTFDGSSHVTRAQLAAFVTRAEKVKHDAVQTMSITLKDYSAQQLIIDGVAYTYSDSVRALFTEANRAVLANAQLKITVEHGVITQIQSLELKTSGTAAAPLVLAGSFATQALIVNANYVTVRDVIALDTITLTNNAHTGILFDRATLRGNITIGANNSQTAATIQFNDSTLGPVTIQARNATITSNTPIAQLTLGSNVANVTLNTDVTSLQVQATSDLTISGEGDIEKMYVENGIDLSLQTAGTISEVVVKAPTTSIRLSNDTNVEDYTLPADTPLESIVTPVPTPAPTPTPSPNVPIIVMKNFTYTGSSTLTHYIGDTFVAPIVKDADGHDVTPQGTVDTTTAGTYTLTYTKEGYSTLVLTVRVEAKEQFIYSGDTTITHYIGDTYAAPAVTDADGNAVTPQGTVDVATAGTYTLTYEKAGYETLTITIVIEAKKNFTYNGSSTINLAIGDVFTPPTVLDAAGNAVTPTTNTVNTAVEGTYEVTYTQVGYNTLTITVTVAAVPLKNFTYTGATSMTHYIGDTYTAPVVTDEDGTAITPAGSVDANTAGTYTLTYSKEGYNTLIITIVVEAKQQFVYNGSSTLTHYIGDTYTAPVVKDANGADVTAQGTVDVTTAGSYTLTYARAGYETLTITVVVEAKKNFVYSGSSTIHLAIGDAFTPPAVFDAAGTAVTPSANNVDTTAEGTYTVTYTQTGYHPLTITVVVTAVPLKNFTYTGATTLTHYIGDVYTAPIVTDEAGTAITPTGSVDENRAGTYTLTYAKEGYHTLVITVDVQQKQIFTYSGDMTMTHYIGDAYTAPVVKDANGTDVTPQGSVDLNTAGTYTLTYAQAGYETLVLTIVVEAKKDFTYNGSLTLTHYIGDSFVAPDVKDANGRNVTPTGTVNLGAVGTYTVTYELAGYNTLTITIVVKAKAAFTYNGSRTITHYIGDTYTAPIVTDADGTAITPVGTVDLTEAGTYTLTYEKHGYNVLVITVHVVEKQSFTYTGDTALMYYVGDAYTAPIVKDANGEDVTPTGTVNPQVAGTYTLTYARTGYHTLTITVQFVEKKSFVYAGSLTLTTPHEEAFTLPEVVDADGNPVTPDGTVNTNIVGTYTLTYAREGYHTLTITVVVEAKQVFLYSNSRTITHYIGDSFMYPFVVSADGQTVVQPLTTIDLNVPGTYTLRYELAGHYPLTITVIVKEKLTFSGAVDQQLYTIDKGDTTFTLPVITDQEGNIIQPNPPLDVNQVGRTNYKYTKTGYHDLTLRVDVIERYEPRFFVTNTNTSISRSEIALYRSASDRDQGISRITDAKLEPGTYYYALTKNSYRQTVGQFTLTATNAARIDIDSVEVVSFTVTAPANTTLNATAVLSALRLPYNATVASQVSIKVNVTPLGNDQFTFEMSKKTYDEQFIHSAVTHRYITIGGVEHEMVRSGTNFTLRALALEGYRSTGGNVQTNNRLLAQYVGHYVRVTVTSPNNEFQPVVRDIVLQNINGFNLDTISSQIAAVMNEVDPGSKGFSEPSPPEYYRMQLQSGSKRMVVQLSETPFDSVTGARMGQSAINSNLGNTFRLDTAVWTGKPIVGSMNTTMFD